MATIAQFEAAGTTAKETAPMQPYYSITELAERWRCSRGTIYNLIRGEKVLDFAIAGHRGKKLVPRDVVRKIEERKMRVFR
jgi:hypothetical protein